jgi:hypothetical protein
VNSQLRALAALSQGKCSRFQLDRRLGRHQGRSRHGGEKYLLLPGIEHLSPGPQSRGLDTVLIQISRLPL